MSANSLLPILVVEDSAEDFLALNRAFRKHALPNPVLRCADGDEALDYLRGYGKNPAWPAGLPALVLLDLNMPGTDGREVLGNVKQDPLLHQIPVVIFSTSSNSRDIEDCYRLGANSYLTKPVSYTDLEEKIRVTMKYWLEASELPKLL